MGSNLHAETHKARLAVIAHILSSVPYEAPAREKIKLPKRQKPHGYEDADFARNWIR